MSFDPSLWSAEEATENTGVSHMDSQPVNKLRQQWVKYKFPDITDINDSLASFAFLVCLI